MLLTIISPENKTLEFQVSDWEAINVQASLTEIMITPLTKDEAEPLFNLLQYHGVQAQLVNTYVIVQKPNSLHYNALPHELKLDYRI